MAEARAFLFRRDLDNGWRIFREGKYIGALCQQRLGGFFRLCRIKPAEEPAHMDIGPGIYGPNAKGERSQVPLNLGDRECANIRYPVGLGERACHQSIEVVDLVEVGHVLELGLMWRGPALPWKVEVDIDGDGRIDIIYFDRDRDGKWDAAWLLNQPEGVYVWDDKNGDGKVQRGEIYLLDPSQTC